MKEDSLNDYKDLISNWTPFSLINSRGIYLNMCISILKHGSAGNHNKICEEIHSYNWGYKTY